MTDVATPDELEELERKIRQDLENGRWLTEVAKDHGVSVAAVRGLLHDADVHLCRKCRGMGRDDDGHSCGPCKGDGIAR